LGLKKIRDAIFSNNLLENSNVKSTSSSSGHPPSGVLSPGRDKFWQARKGVTEADLEFDLGEEKTFDCLVIQENIELGQRVEQFSLEIWSGDRWKEITRSTTIGNKRMLRFSPQTAQKVRLRLLQARWSPAISFAGLYKRLPELNIEPSGGAFSDEMQVKVSTNEKGPQIYYTLDGSDPTSFSLKYTQPLSIKESTHIRAIAIDNRGIPSFIREGDFTKATFSMQFSKPPSPKYLGKDQLTILDGRKGTLDFAGGEWLGWEGEDMVLTIDYKEVKNFSMISAGFLHDQGSWIFHPKGVMFEVSRDGRIYLLWGREANSEHWDQAGAKRKEFSAVGQKQARFVRITAKSIVNCPKGHAGEGGKAWLFCDEISLK